MKIFLSTLLFLTIAAAAGVTLIWTIYNPADLPLELAKACLNIFTAAVVVQLITFIVAEAANARKVRAEQDDFRRNTLVRLNTAFIAIKALRRSTRANLQASKADAATAQLGRHTYQKIMKDVNDIQLDLELLAKDIETSHEVFADSQSIYLNVSKMEEYLNGLVDEWEESGRLFLSNRTVSLSSLPKLMDLLGDYQISRFRPLLVHNYYRAVELVRISMTAGRSLRWKVVLAPLVKPPLTPDSRPRT